MMTLSSKAVLAFTAPNLLVLPVKQIVTFENTPVNWHARAIPVALQGTSQVDGRMITDNSHDLKLIDQMPEHTAQVQRVYVQC